MLRLRFRLLSAVTALALAVLLTQQPLVAARIGNDVIHRAFACHGAAPDVLVSEAVSAAGVVPQR